MAEGSDLGLSFRLCQIYCVRNRTSIAPSVSEALGFVPVVDGLGRDIGKTRAAVLRAANHRERS